MALVDLAGAGRGDPVTDPVRHGSGRALEISRQVAVARTQGPAARLAARHPGRHAALFEYMSAADRSPDRRRA